MEGREFSIFLVNDMYLQINKETIKRKCGELNYGGATASNNLPSNIIPLRIVDADKGGQLPT